MADRQGLPLPSGLGEDARTFRDGGDFIRQYTAMCGLLNDLDDFRRLGHEVSQDLAATGVLYAEAVFSPSNHAQRLGDEWYGPIEAVLDGLATGARELGATVQLTPDIVRGMGTAVADRVLEVALRFAGRGVVALDCAGSELPGIEPLEAYFRAAKEAGLGSVPHAGEWAGPQNVWDTLEAFAPDRIGHGISAAQDPMLTQTIADRGVVLDVSPLSNVATATVPSLAEHPFLRLRDAGVTVTLNSDDPPMFGNAWLSDVYAAAADTWALTDEELADIARTGVRASFADVATKTEIEHGIDAWLAAPADDGPPDAGTAHTGPAVAEAPSAAAEGGPRTDR
jgi:aminodeoxyfutalosine deaminase